MAEQVTTLNVASIPAPPASLFREFPFSASQQGQQTIVPGVDGSRIELYGWDFTSKGVNVANFGSLGYIVLDEGSHAQRDPGDSPAYVTEAGQGLHLHLGCAAEVAGKVFYREVRS